MQSPIHFYIVDGSDAKYALKNQKSIVQSGLKVTYYHDTDSPNEVVSMAKIRYDITEKYTIFAGDDDFLLSPGLSRCVTFLDQNHDYDVCSGARILFNETQSQFEIRGASCGFDWDYDSPSKRFLEYMMDGNSTNYSVHRTNLWQTILEDTDIQTRYIGTELLMCCSTVIRARLKRLYCVLVLREDAGTAWPNINCPTGNDFFPMFQLVCTQEWIEAIPKLKQKIVQLLMQYENLSEVQAAHIFNMGFPYRIVSMLNSQFGLRYKQELAPLLELYRLKGAVVQNQKSQFKEDVEFIKKHFKFREGRV